jgi:hypothetical protein
MVWGAIGFGLKSELVFFENGTVNSHQYLAGIQGLCDQADSTYGARNWVFVQDGAACHTSQEAVSTLCQRCVLNPEWPPNSPDLNPIETVWGVMKRRMKWDQVGNIEDAKDQLIRHWNDLPQSMLDSLCQSFAGRVRMVRDALGQTIQPLLSNHQTSVPPNYLPDRPATPEFIHWTKDEETRLLAHIAAHGKPAWGRMTANFPGRSPTSLRTRYRTLEIIRLNEEQ